MTFLEALAPIGSLEVVVDQYVPLTRAYQPTGAQIDVAFIRIGHRVLIHPKRMADIKAALARPLPTSAEIGRWLDDGGAR